MPTLWPLPAEVPLTSASMTTRDLLALYNSMFSDSALEQKGTTYISTTQAEDMDITFTLFTFDSKVTGYSMTMKADQEGAIVSVDASMKGKELAMTMEMSTPPSSTRPPASPFPASPTP